MSGRSFTFSFCCSLVLCLRFGTTEDLIEVEEECRRVHLQFLRIEKMDPLSLLVAHADSVRVPNKSDKVYKEECIYSFDSPVSLDRLSPVRL